MRHMHARWLGDTENINGDAKDGSSDPTTQWTRVDSSKSSSSSSSQLSSSAFVTGHRWETGDPKMVTCPPLPLRHQNRRRHRRHNLSTFIIILTRILSASTSSTSSSPSSSSISDRPTDVEKNSRLGSRCRRGAICLSDEKLGYDC